MCTRAQSMQGKPAVVFIEDDREVGAGEQDRLDAVAPLQLGRDAAQAGGVLVVAALGVEDALVGPADEGDLVGLRLHDLHAGELAPQAALHGEGRAEQRHALELALAKLRADGVDDVDQRQFYARRQFATQMCGVTAGSTAACAPARPSRSMKPAR